MVLKGITNTKKKKKKKKLLVAGNKDNDDEIIPYVSTHNTWNKEALSIIKLNFPILTQDTLMTNVLKFIKRKRQPLNLKRLITTARFTDSAFDFKVTRCNKLNCKLCKHLNKSDSFKFKGKIFNVNATLSCYMRNVLHVMACNGCGEYYIDLTEDFICGEVLRPMGSCRARSVHLAILILGRLSHLSWLPVLCTFFRQKLTTALLE